MFSTWYANEEIKMHRNAAKRKLLQEAKIATVLTYMQNDKNMM